MCRCMINGVLVLQQRHSFIHQHYSGCVQSKLSLEKAIRADKTFEKAIVALSNTYIHEGNTERAVEL